RYRLCLHFPCLHAPAPTVTYPLSLHDALPICFGGRVAALRQCVGAHPCASKDARDPDATKCRARRHSSTPRLCDSPRFRKKARQDRKSTRLNSSHQIISYAVFCLKKKIKIKKT